MTMTFSEAFDSASNDLDKQMMDVQKKMNLLIKKIGSNKADWYLYALLDYEFLLDLIVPLKPIKNPSKDMMLTLKAFYDLQERLSAQ